MSKEGRYDVSDSIEAQFEPASNDTVLKNKLGITQSDEMDKIEAQALINATDTLIHEYDSDHKFSAKDICHMHNLWLIDIYEWAGKYRSVNISKAGFTFAMSAQIPKLMELLEAQQLEIYTPCKFECREDIIQALAEVHTELLLIHPFREGNGRCSRILSTIMALQAGLPLLDFSLIVETKKQDYITAVQYGMDRNYEPMKKLFSEIIEKSISAFSS